MAETVWAGWTNSPVSINTSPGTVNVHYNSGNRRIVRIGDTVIALVPESGSQDHTYRSTDGGESWSEIDTDGEFSGVLILGPGNYVCHFYHSDSDNTIKMVKFLYNEIPGSPTTIQTGLSELAVDDVYKMMSATVDSTGNLYIAYCHGNPDSCYCSKSSDSGNTWSIPSTIVASSGDVSNYYIKIEADQDDNLLATWTEWSSGPGYFSKSIDGGESWTSTQLADANRQFNFDILPANTKIYYVFAQSKVSPLGCVFRKSIDGGSTWSDWASIETTISSKGYADPSAALASDGTIYVSYRNDSETGSENWREHIAASSDGGDTWNIVYDYDEAAERVGTRSHLRYQTHYSGGGQLDWIWMQYVDSGANHPIYFNTNVDVAIADYADNSKPIAPTVTGTTPTNDTTPTWNWSSGGGGNGTFRYKLDDSDLSTGATETIDMSYTPTSALSEGLHVLYVQESDDESKWSDSGSYSIVVDITAPTAPIVTGSTPTNDTTPTWSWSPGGGGNGTYRYKLDDIDLSTGAIQIIATSYTPDTAFSDGSTHTLYVQERDAAGNWSDSGSKSISIDAAGTPLSILTDTLQNGVIAQAYSVTLEANVTDVTWTITGGNLPDGVSLTDDTISGIPTMDGDYNFVITATDNSSGATADKSFTLTIEQNGSIEVSVTDAIRGTTVIVSSNSGNISNLQAQNPDDLSAPSDYNFSYGVFKFQVTDLAAGGSATITFNFEDAISQDIVWYWYNPDTSIWTDISDDVNLTINGSQVQITLTDDGIGDSDDIPGQITDPSGPALAMADDSNEDNSPDDSSDVLDDGKDEDGGGCFITTAGE